MTASEVFNQNDGEVTTRYYKDLSSRGPAGLIGVALFRAQKRSTAAKKYSRGRFRRQAYDVKSWSMSELVNAVSKYGQGLGISCGWKEDPAVLFGEQPPWVLYCDLPTGQCSFHSPTRLPGPDYPGSWDGQFKSAERILAFCDSVFNGTTASVVHSGQPTQLELG